MQICIIDDFSINIINLSSLGDALGEVVYAGVIHHGMFVKFC